MSCRPIRIVAALVLALLYSNPAVAQSIDLQITDITDSPAEIVLGQGNVTYTITLYNASSSTATNTVLGVDISQSATYVSASATHGGTCGNPSPGVVRCNWTTHDAFAGHTATIVMTPGQISTDGINAVSAGYYSDDQADPDYANNADTENTTVTATPGAPAITGITPGPGQLSVAFTPGDPGGLPLTTYEYSIDAGANFTARSPASTLSPLVITGLTPGTMYPVSLRAVNANGAGEAAAPVNGMPCAPNQLVTSTGDDGAGSLRQALLLACAGDTITFDLPGAGPHIITLTSGQLEISKNLTISGPGATLLTVQRSTASGTPEFRIFNILSGLTVAISGMTMANGLASATDAGFPSIGGAILNFGASVTIDSCTIAGNTAGLGGGVANAGQSLTRMTIVNSTVSGNTALGIDFAPLTSAGGGGVINLGAAWLTLSGSTVSGNMSARNGGAIDFYGISGLAFVTIHGSALVDNIATGDGGAIHVAQTAADPAVLIVTNSTISGNRANGSGGGVAIDAAASTGPFVELGHATVTNNRADADTDGSGTGGGVRTLAADQLPRLRNTIVAGNFVGGTGSAADDVNGALDASSSNTLIGDGTGLIGLTHGVSGHQIGTAGSPIDARLGPLANNGGPTRSHALLSDSPALDAGTDPLLTTLADAMDAATTTLPGITNPVSLAVLAAGLTIQVDAEQMLITQIVLGPALAITVTRGANGTTPAAHAADAGLFIVFDQRGVGYARVLDAADSGSTRTADIGALEQNPTIADISDPAMISEDASRAVTVEVGDGDSLGANDLTATSSNATLVPNAPGSFSFSGSGTSRTLTITPAPNQHGVATITVTATKTIDGVAQTASNTFVLTVSPVADTPSVTDATTSEDGQTASGLVIGRHAGDDAEVTHFKITGITNGTLYQANGSDAIADGAFITVEQGAAGLKFSPNANFFGVGQFSVRASLSGVDAGLGGGTATATITVNAVGEAPGVTNPTTRANVQTSSGLVITPNAADGASVTHFRITNITNGTLFKTDGTTPILEGGLITVADGATGLRFTPATGSLSAGSFTVQAGTDGVGGGLGVASVATITVIKHDTHTVFASEAPDPSEQQEEVQLVIEAASSTGGPTPTGTVTVSVSGGPETCTATLNGAGRGECSIALTEPGVGRTLTAVYDGDALNNVSTSNAVEPHTVTACTVNPSITTNADSGPGSLREALQIACANSTLTLDAIASPIRVTSATLTLAKHVTILGPGANLMRIRGNGLVDVSVFTINPGRTVTIDGITIANGSAPVGLPMGGGINNQGGTLTLRNSELVDNGASLGGAIFTGSVGTFAASTTIVNSTLRGNGADHGGAIYSSGTLPGLSTLTIVNSTISGNTAAINGGGIATTGAPGAAPLMISSSTLTDNHAAFLFIGSGGGLHAEHGPVVLTNTIVAANRAGSAVISADDIAGAIDTAGSFNNLIGVDTNLTGVAHGANGNLVGSAGSALDPRLAPLASNGGATWTHALLAGSPALDAGNDALVTTPPLPAGSPLADQRGTGFVRILDAADADKTPAVDIGAVEQNPAIQTLANRTMTEDGSLSFSFDLGDDGADAVTASSSDATLVPNAAATLSITGSGATRTITMSPAGDRFGTTTITITAAKTIGGVLQTMAAAFELTVTGVDDPPTLNPIANPAAILEDAAQQTIGLSGITPGPGSEAGSLTVTATSDNPALIPHPSVSYLSPFAAGSLAYTPVANAHGSAVITVTVTDAGGGASSVSQTFTVTVTPVAETPSVTPAVTALNTQTSSGLVIARHAADGAEVTHVKITGISGGTLFQNDGTMPIANGAFITIAQGAAGLKFTPAPDSSATGHFTVQASRSASDAGLGGDEVTATIGVQLAAPVITSIAPGDGSLSIVFTPPALNGGAPITNYAYSLDNGASWTLRMPAATTAPLVITGLASETYVIRLRAINLVGPGAMSAPMTGEAFIKVEQTISFAVITDQLFSAGPLTLSAVASSGLPVTFTATGACSVAGNVLTFLSIGACSVTAAQAGDATTYLPASETRRFTIAPVFTVTPTSIAAAQPAGSTNVTVTASPSAAVWTASTNASWLTVTPLDASGTSQAALMWTANADAGARTATATIAGHAVTVTQTGCAATLSPATLLVSDAAATGTITLSTGLACEWTAASDQPWITLTPVNATGPASIAYEVGAWAGAVNRTATLTIAGQLLTVTQLAASPSAPGPPPGPPPETPPGPGPTPGPNPPGPPPPLAVPSSPADFTGLIADGVLTLMWNGGAGGGEVTGHLIEAGTAPGLEDIGTAAAGPERTWQFVGVPPGRYYFRVRATNASGVSLPSNEIELTYGMPDIPQNLSARLVDAMVILNWTAPLTDAVVVGYVLEVGLSPSTTAMSFTLPPAPTFFSHSPVPPGITFYVRLRAVLQDGAMSAPSNEVVVRR